MSARSGGNGGKRATRTVQWWEVESPDPDYLELGASKPVPISSHGTNDEEDWESWRWKELDPYDGVVARQPIGSSAGGKWW
jgi:hypothetical protein